VVEEEEELVLASATISTKFDTLQYDAGCWLEPL
jgi:hypothetical protein